MQKRRAYRLDLLICHDQLAGDGGQTVKTAPALAQVIERDIVRTGWEVGRVIGCETTLRAEFQVGRRGLQEAVRILESRSAARMRRGPGGGLVVTAPAEEDVANAVADHFEASGLTGSHATEALAVLEWLQDRRVRVSRVRMDLLAAFEQADPQPESGDQAAATSRTAALVLGLMRSAMAELERRRDHPPDPGATSMRRREAGRATRAGAHRFGGWSPNARPTNTSELVQRISSDIFGLQPAAVGGRLANEEQLCERYGVSRSLMRPAIRILENDGVLESQRGKSRGLILRRPHARSAIEFMATYLSSRRIETADLSSFSRRLAAVMSALAVLQRGRVDQQERLSACVPNAKNQLSVLFAIRREWRQSGNAAIEFVARSLVASASRRLSENFKASDAQMNGFALSFAHWARAVRQGDVMAVRQVLGERGAILQQMGLGIAATV